MKNITFNSDWKNSWKDSYYHDLLDIYGDKSNLGYVYHYANRRKYTIDFIEKVATKGAKVLDVAAAQGNFSLLLAELGYEVTWNDLREDLVGYVKLKYEYGNISFCPGNIFDLNLDCCYDVVLITEIIEHVAHPDEFLRKIAHLVKPGGHIILSTPNGQYFRNSLPKFSDCPDPSKFEEIQYKPDADGHIFLLHLDELETLADRTGLILKETKLFTNFLTRGGLKTEAVLKYLPRSFVEGFEIWTESLPLFLSKRINIGTLALLARPNENIQIN